MLRLALILLFVAAPAFAVSTSTVTYHGKTRGYLAVPDSPGRHPGIILIHEWWGLNDYIREMARKFAREGYVALAVDLYNGKSTTKREEAGKLAGAVRKDVPAAMANLTDGFAFLRKHKRVDGKRLASIGWCFGGSWSLAIAKNNLGPAKATIIYYYGHFNPKDDLQMMKAKIQGHFGELDKGIRVETVRELQAKLRVQDKDHEIFIYPNADHAFANQYSDRFNKKASETAWKRTLGFLKKYL